jgi:predicted  nucleic acid-binding Zn-ribbon protein
MKARLSQAEFRRRFAELGERLGELERRVADPEISVEVTQARRRYDEMRQRLEAAKDGDEPGALEQDYEGLVDSVSRWMARQDAGGT